MSGVSVRVAWKKLGFGLFAVILTVNLAVLDYFYWTKNARQDLANPSTPTPPSLAVESDCDDSCKTYIDQKLSLLPTALPTESAKPKTIVASTSKPKTLSVSYFAIPGSGSTSQNDWTDIVGTDFYFDPAEHPGLKEVRFEGNIRLLNGNGTVFVRIYDVTHTIGVPSEITASGTQAPTLTTSDKINFWSGRNQYRIQAKSLTADTAIFDSGRLRMVIEN